MIMMMGLLRCAARRVLIKLIDRVSQVSKENQSALPASKQSSASKHRVELAACIYIYGLDRKEL
jgi:hypothetical protein